ncbi:hypothetical protein CASFOL_017103 [Castilleja foliolosa]|uniref:Uncharacterized protein n=1 Tax=Castilleja foliolosa TaxID=1961234 RepID=A0ABD3DC80_9LAMI
MIGSYLLLCFNLLFIISFVSEANINAEAISEVENEVYIVYMGGLSSHNGATINDHAQLLSELMDRKKDSVVHTYNKSLLGFAARLSNEEAESMAQRSGVVSVFPDRVSQLHTTRSWDFLKYQDVAFKTDDDHSSDKVSWSTPADTIIGILDTGIWPEHPSFNDKYMGRIPPRWKGECASGNNSTYSFKCNRKLIGARFYDDPDALEPIVTARDYDGHGTHVASIAAGMPISGASYYGLARGTARGGSPSSRIAMYRVCTPEVGCPDSSILKAFDDAIADGVDVLSLSMSGDYESLLTNTIAIGAFHAMEKGITVVCSAGNNGPETVSNDAPWLVTVAATTIDRDFEVDVVLGNRAVIKGGGINFSGLNKSAVHRLVDGRTTKSNQTNNINRGGTIVLCDDPSTCVKQVDNQGAIGMILIGDDYRQLPYDNAKYFHVDSVAVVTTKDGARILSYINSTRDPLATILPTRVIPNNYMPAPVAAYFSSSGPSKAFVNILKPDIAAPGVGILGAWRMNDTSLANPGKEPPIFNIDSGTSQACPHVSGLAANVKSWHPTWTPSAIRSAITTTAIQKNNLNAPITTNSGTRATPYDIGAGEISLFGPFCPGLVYETQPSDYIQFLCNMGYNASAIKSISSTVPNNFSCPNNSSPDLISDMNYPSIVVSGLKANGTRTVKRTVTNVGEERSIYMASVEAPAGMRVQVVPKILRFTKAVKRRSFLVRFTPTTTFKGPLFGSITWSSINNVKVRSPFAVIISNV